MAKRSLLYEPPSYMGKIFHRSKHGLFTKILSMAELWLVSNIVRKFTMCNMLHEPNNYESCFL